jgi:secreted PhoX family phosphatase
LITLDVIGDQFDIPDMNVVNETGGHVGRYLYRTHEIGGGDSAISAIDPQTGLSQVYTASDLNIDPAWSNLDGIEWTPWGTLLVAEEIMPKSSGDSGRLFECDVDGLILNCVDRPALGRRAHEGIVVAPNGNLFGGDELNGGSVYRFVPDRYGDLSAGTLYALNIPGSTTVCSGKPDEGVTPTGQAEWIPLIPGQNGVVTDPAVDSRAAANEAGASDFCRPEDAERIGPNLYIAATTTKNVLHIPVNTETPVVTEFAGINTNMNNEDEMMEFGLRAPDNLASDRAGNLYIVEDNTSQSDVWVATKDRNHDGVADNVYLFATLTTLGAEGTGIYFPRTRPKTMLINVAHSLDENDMTIAITKD